MKAPLLTTLRRRLRQSARRRVNIRCQLELLESRWLMASDLASWYQASSAEGGEVLVGPVRPLALEGTADTTLFSTVAQNAEGEAEDDLVAFAEALTAAGVKFFGADWCPFCTDQKELFQDGARYLNVIEVTNPDRTLNDIGVAEGITTFPTWHFPDGSRVTGVLSLTEISDRAGVPIPTGVAPSFFPLEDVTLSAGSPIFLPIDAYDPNGGPLTITAVSTNPSVVSTAVPQGNPSLRITVRNYGDMVFELFEDKVPRPTGRIIELVQSGFYDADTQENPIIFHRVIEDFVLQAGDPTRTGAGGSTLGNFDDQFHVDLQHNQAGVLSFAKAGDDTNDSQFFITAGLQRELDFNHSVFGQLIEGDGVRQGIDRVPKNAQDRPTRDVEIVSMSIELDQENGLVMLKAPHGVTGESDVTLTVTDADGNSSSQTIRVTVVADTFNSAPFLDVVPPRSTTVNTPLTFDLSAQDVEGDPLYFDAVPGSGSATFEFDIDHDTGGVTVTPPQGFTGTLQLLVGVRGANPTDSVDQFDTQLLSIDVAPTAPTALDLLPEYDSGVSDSDNITNLKQLGVRVEGLTSGAFVSVLVGNVVVGQAIATGDSMVIDTDLTAFPDGVHALTATQQSGGVTSARSAALEVTLDTIEVTGEEILRYRLSTTRLDGTAADSFAIGEEFYLQVYVADRRENAQGVSAAYLDVLFSNQLVTTAGPLVFSEQFPGDRAGDLDTPTRINDAGAVADVEEVEVGEALLFEIRLRALAGGEELIQSSFADNSPLRDSFVIGTTQPLAENRINFGSVTVQITTPFTAVNDLFNTDEDTSAAFDVLANDTYPGGDVTELRVSEVGTPNQGGTVAIAEDGRINYQPAANFFGVETFTYTITDDENGTSTATVTVQVQPVNDPPTAVDDSFTGDDAVARNSANNTLNLLANDTFAPDVGEVLRITSVGTTSHGGVVTIAPNGTHVLYTPATGFTGTETFEYTISDGNEGTDTAAVTVEVAAPTGEPTFDPPVARDDTGSDRFTVRWNSEAQNLEVLRNDSIDPDYDGELTILSVTAGSASGVITVAADGKTVRYTPATGFLGTETFQYTIGDGSGSTDSANVAVEVREVIPGQIGGQVYLDRNNNGQRDGSEEPVIGVEVKLQGTDDLGQAVQRTTVTDRQGKYHFADLPPGTYTVTETRPSFFAPRGAATDSGSGTPAFPSLVIELAEGAEVMDSNFAEQGPAASYVNIRDLFASNHAQSILLVVNNTTHHAISVGSESWQAVQITSAKLADDQGHWELTAQDVQQNQFVATLPNQPSRDLHVMGSSGGQTMLRLYGTPESLRFVPVTSTSSAAAQGTDATTATQEATTGNDSPNTAESSEAEGEAPYVSRAVSAQPEPAASVTVPPLPKMPALRTNSPRASISVTPVGEIAVGESPVTSENGDDNPDEVTTTHGDIFATSSEETWTDRLESEVLEALASQETLKPKAVQSALFSMMFASSSR